MKLILTEEQKKELEEIKNRATKIHNDTNQKYDNDRDYSFHLCMVADIMTKYYDDLGELPDYDLYKMLYFAALFHDSIEDARLTYNDVLSIAKEYMTKGYAKASTEIVYALTNEKGRNRKERANEKYYSGIRDTKFAPFIKACDRLANVTYACLYSESDHMAKVYRKELDDFLTAIDEKGNKVPKRLITELKLLLGVKDD
jgi:(p)ppGpp synthase/HD superfamily hydrolase